MAQEEKIKDETLRKAIRGWAGWTWEAPMEQAVGHSGHRMQRSRLEKQMQKVRLEKSGIDFLFLIYKVKYPNEPSGLLSNTISHLLKNGIGR